MKTIKTLLITTLVSIYLWSCGLGEKHRDGKFMKDVVNLAEFNSQYDDYNSDLPSNKYGETYLIFSSKRDNQTYYNLVGFPVKLEYDSKKNIPVLVRSNVNLGSFISKNFVSTFVNKINGDFNILGPCVLGEDNLVSYGTSPKYQFVFYADDKDKNLDIKVIYSDKNGKEIGPIKIDYLNSKADDAYPFITYLGNKAFFCSNRGGSFDIYQTTISEQNALSNNSMIEQIINPKEPFTQKITNISSENGDDKCPYLWGGGEGLMVFTSNRAGGFGGYDIYYSVFENGVWGLPINAGPRINTQYDEYRPILPKLSYYTYPLMIFSSNRPGGKGGFDLYMTGLAETDNMRKVIK